MSNDPIVTISTLTKYIKRTFDNDELLQNIWVRGEISNFKRHNRGHMYFSIKDEQAKISAVMFAGNNRFLKFAPEDGMNVIVRGSVTVYEATGQYQIYVNEMQPDGIGNLHLAFEQLKEKLNEKGYFDDRYKKILPSFPREIGIITSPTGAAIRDIMTTIKRRFPIVKLSLFPVLVQGSDAPSSIAKAIEQANQLGTIDCIIVGRGGGSIEELWAFNEEVVADAIFQSKVPIISAVGHETDFTIADFVADIRAATPTAAAELAVPTIQELLEKIGQRTLRLKTAMTNKIETEQVRLLNKKNSYAFRYPAQLLTQKEQELDRIMERLDRIIQLNLDRKKERYSQIHKDLLRNHPKSQMDEAKKQLLYNLTLLSQNMKTLNKGKSFQFQQLVTKLEAMSPLSVMKRGFSLSYTSKGQMITSIDQVQKDQGIIVKVKDGNIVAVVDKVEKGEV